MENPIEIRYAEIEDTIITNIFITYEHIDMPNCVCIDGIEVGIGDMYVDGTFIVLN